MSLATGAKSGLNFKEETAYGVAPTGNWEQMSFNNETLQETVNTVISNEIKADRTVGSVRGGNIAAGGGINLDLYASKIGIWLKHSLSTTVASVVLTPTALAALAYTRGTYVTSNGWVHVCTVAGTTVTLGAGLTSTTLGTLQTIDGATFMAIAATGISLKTHTITAGPDFPTGGISIEKVIRGGNAINYFSMLGGRINTLSFTIPQEGIITADIALLSTKFNAPSLTSIAGTPVEVPDDPYTGFEAEIKINTIAQTIVQNGTIQINNNFDANTFVVGNRYRKDLPPGRREITGTLTLFFEDITQYNLFRNEARFGLFVTMIHDGNYLELDMPECKYTGGAPTPQIAGNGTITQSFNFNAMKDNQAYDIKVTLKNQMASY